MTTLTKNVFYTIAECAEILGVSRQRAAQLSKSPRFPSPDAVTAHGYRLWKRSKIESWDQERRDNPRVSPAPVPLRPIPES